jgi:hypothetical protein
MRPHLTLRRHADLVDRMARHLGADLEEAVLRGRLAPDELPDMVLRCAGCARPGDCAAMLEAAAVAARPDDMAAPTPPYYCRNAGIFDDLAKA